MFGGEVRWCSSANEDRVDRMRSAQSFEFNLEGIQVCGDQLVFAGDDGEVAVATAMDAERHMDVGRTRLGIGRGSRELVHVFRGRQYWAVCGDNVSRP